MCMVEICNRQTLQSKVNMCKSDVKIGYYADSLCDNNNMLYKNNHSYDISQC